MRRLHGRKIDFRQDIDEILNDMLPDTDKIFNREDLITGAVDKIVDVVINHMKEGVDAYTDDVTG